MEFNSEIYAAHLAGMVKIPTVSDADPEKMDYDQFFRLHAYLEETWPLVHQKMSREVIGRCGLLYHYEAKERKQLPLMLIAHQDVVPVGDLSLWKYPPFSAEIDDNMIWGRGSTDSKCNIQAYMDALEQLFSEGFEPAYDIYLGFGYNEEIMGGPEPAAQLIANTLKERGIELGCLIDECGGVRETEDGRTYVQIFICEKGYADFKFTKRSSGGHSSTPTPHSALGDIAKVACILEDHPMDPLLTEPVVQQLQANVPFMKDAEMAALCTDVKANWEMLLPIMAADRTQNALIRTTMALSMAKGSDQANILPEVAWIIVNNRLLPGQTLDDVMAHYKALVPEDVEIELVKGSNPPKVQSTDSTAYKIISETFAEMYPGVVMIPSVLAGGTDSRYYCDVCPTDSVYRVTGLKSNPRWGHAHQVNERIGIEALADNVRFYVKLLQNYGK